MEILLATDNNYVMPTGVLMTSISMNNKDVRYHILIDETLEESNKMLLSSQAEVFGDEVFFYSVDAEMKRLFPMEKGRFHEYISVVAYYRLLVADLLPRDIHKILYLDCDTVVRKSLVPLWNTDISGFAAGVVHDMDEQMHIDSGRLPYPMSRGYFNSGMLLINLDYWRSNNLSKVFLQFAEENADSIVLHDQDVLNSTIFDKVKQLPITYNFQSGFLLAVPDMIYYVPFLKDEILRTEGDPAIIHYTYIDKPWIYECRHPQRYVWEHYRRFSIWNRKKIPVRATIRHRVACFFRKHNFWFSELRRDSPYRNIYKRVILWR